MEPFTPFAGPCANGLPPWHHFDRPFNDDSGYASEDSDSAPFLSSDPDNDPEYTNQVLPWMQRHRTAAFASAPWSHPVALTARHPFHDSLSDSYDLPHPLPFEEPPNDHVSSSHPQPPPSYHRRDVCDRGPGHMASRSDPEEKTSSSPPDFAERGARIPDATPSLSTCIQSETDHRPPSPNPLRLDFSSPDVKTEPLYPLPSITSARPYDDEEGYPISCSASPRPQCQHRSASHNAQLYHERTELERDRRALRKREKSLSQREGGGELSEFGETLKTK